MQHGEVRIPPDGLACPRLGVNYHFGPQKIQMYLDRYNDIQISASGIWRILKRLDMNRLPSSQRYKRHRQRWKRYEKQQPGQDPDRCEVHRPAEGL